MQPCVAQSPSQFSIKRNLIFPSKDLLLMSVFNEIVNREFGGTRRVGLKRKLCGSPHFVERFTLVQELSGHTGCVNTIIFSDDGSKCITGSDDTFVNFFDVDTGELINRISTMHTNNIFFAKDVPGSGCETLITCAADGRVVLTHVKTNTSQQLHRHRGRAHRIAMIPGSPHQFYSCGEDGDCCFFDIRTPLKEFESLTARESITGTGSSSAVLKTGFTDKRGSSCSIYAIGVNPLRSHEIAFCGATQHAALYDVRQFGKPMSFLCPMHLANSSDHVTGLRYDCNGEHIILSYNDDDVYRLNIAAHSRSEILRRNIPAPGPGEDSSESYATRYSGHRNSRTVKQVNYFGDNSEFVVSGSDCGHIFLWETETGEVVKVLKGDSVGAVNCLSSHPHLPLLATSGLEHTGKIWGPVDVGGSLTAEDAVEAAVVTASDRDTRVRARVVTLAPRDSEEAREAYQRIASRNRERREGGGGESEARLDELRFLLRFLPAEALAGLVGGASGPVASREAAGGAAGAGGAASRSREQMMMMLFNALGRRGGFDSPFADSEEEDDEDEEEDDNDDNDDNDDDDDDDEDDDGLADRGEDDEVGNDTGVAQGQNDDDEDNWEDIEDDCD